MFESTNDKSKKMILDELEANGVIGQMKAKLKSNIINVIKNQKKEIQQKLDFEFLTTFQKQSKKSDKLMLLSHLILEFLQFYELEYTTPVYKSETNIKEAIKKDTLIKDSGLSSTYDKDQPILLQVFNSYFEERNKKDKFGKNKVYEDIYKNDKEIPSSNLGLITGGLSGYGLNNNKYNFSTSYDHLQEDKNSDLGSVKSKKLAPLSFGASNVAENEAKEEKISPFAMLLKKKEEQAEESNLEKENKTKEDKFNNTDVYDSNEKGSLDYDNYLINNNNKDVMSLSDEDIKEEIFDSHENNENNDIYGDKEKSDIYNHTSSQTFGYDNSVTSYNLDFYDYVEDVLLTSN